MSRISLWLLNNKNLIDNKKNQFISRKIYVKKKSDLRLQPERWPRKKSKKVISSNLYNTLHVPHYFFLQKGFHFPCWVLNRREECLQSLLYPILFIAIYGDFKCKVIQVLFKNTVFAFTCLSFTSSLLFYTNQSSLLKQLFWTNFLEILKNERFYL